MITNCQGLQFVNYDFLFATLMYYLVQLTLSSDLHSGHGFYGQRNLMDLALCFFFLRL